MATITGDITVKRTVVNTGFKKLAEELDLKTAAMARDFARAVARDAAVRAPVRTGHLRDSIKASNVGAGHWKVDVGARYGGFVEYGTRYMAAQPYFTPALEAQKIIFRAKLQKLFS